MPGPSLNRRSLLMRALGIGAAASTVKPGAVSAILADGDSRGRIFGMDIPSIPPFDPGVGSNGLSGREEALLEDLTRAASREIDMTRREMPADIATKKSWSPVFKEHLRRQRIADLEVFRSRLVTNEKLMTSLLDLLTD